MKKVIIISSCIAMCALSKATVRTVCNLPSPSAQYSTIQAAVDASSSGDTVLVQGSGLTYAGFSIPDKKLAIIGPGWKPLRNVPALTATVSTSFINGTASSGSEIHGLTFTGILYIDKYVSISNIKIVRNHFFKDLNIGYNNSGPGTGQFYNGYLIEGNWFENASFRGRYSQNYSDFIIRNNIFYNSLFTGFVAVSNIIVDHNLFYATSSFTISVEFCYNFSFQNNIFCRANIVNPKDGFSNSSFKNNITFNINTTAPWTLNGNIDGGGNVLNQDPQMTAQTQVNSGVNDPLLNFTIAVGPANNKGTDGKDMGLLFDKSGSLNWSNCRNSRLPYVYDINITNPNIAPGGTLNISIEARKSK